MGVFDNVIKGSVFTPLCFLLAEGARFGAPDISWLSEDPGEFIRLSGQRMVNAYGKVFERSLSDWAYPFKALYNRGYVHQVGSATTLGVVTPIANELLKKFPKMRENTLLRYSVSLLVGAGASYLAMGHLCKGKPGQPFVDTVLSVAMVALPWKVATEALHFGSTAIGWSVSLIPQICRVGQKVADAVSFPGGPHIADAQLPFVNWARQEGLDAALDIHEFLSTTSVPPGTRADGIVAEVHRLFPGLTGEQAARLATLIPRRAPPDGAGAAAAPPVGRAAAAAAAAAPPPERRAAATGGDGK